jgi:hypothetical protein
VSTDFATSAKLEPLPVARAPRWPAPVSGAACLVALSALLLGGGEFRIALVGYLVGAIVVPIITIVYRFKRQAARKSPFFIPNLTVERLMFALLGLALLTDIGNAWHMATELAKQ